MKCEIRLLWLLLINMLLYWIRDIDPSATSRPSNTKALVKLLRDSSDWLSAVKNLRETDVIILLTPVVIPISQDATDTSDPFEPLGRSLAKRHSKIRQVPYTRRSVTPTLPD